MSELGYALIVHPDDTETPIENLRVSVHIKLNGYIRDVLASAKRLPDRHARRGEAFLVGAGWFTL